jgi:hypothetical protein
VAAHRVAAGERGDGRFSVRAFSDRLAGRKRDCPQLAIGRRLSGVPETGAHAMAAVGANSCQCRYAGKCSIQGITVCRNAFFDGVANNGSR